MYHCNTCTCLVLTVSDYLYPKHQAHPEAQPMQLNDCALKSTAQEMQRCRASVASLRTDLALLHVSNQSKIVSSH